MKENIPMPSGESEEEIKLKRVKELAIELSESMETFPFPGINQESYDRLKTEEEEFPGFATPIDELNEKFNQNGIQIVLGKTISSGNIMVLPSNSDDLDDNLRLKHLNKNNISDTKLLELLELCGF